jgi:MHS family proline/betaine transporter-like MFS transporter
MILDTTPAALHALVKAYSPARSSRESGTQMESRQAFRVVAAGMIGNVLEWYDFAIYGYFATAIGRQFFPHEDRA